jgi:diguanylate cyclase (GGDEF)-like protein/PAS domain S-box-containing protein
VVTSEPCSRRGEAAGASFGRWYRVLFEASPVGVALADENGLLVVVNPAYCALLGRPAAELIGRSPREFIHPEDLAEHDETARHMAVVDVADSAATWEKRYLQPDGTVRWGWMAVAHVPGPDGQRWKMATVHDTTDRRRTEDALRAQASTDPLTGLVNRRGWRTQLGDLVADRSLGEPLTIAVIDLDHFKAYNDTYGHQGEDRALREFATGARAVLRSGDVLARWGGEEFALALPRCTSAHATKVLAALSEQMPAGLTFSAGHTTMNTGETVADTWDRADTLLYTAKRTGRARTLTDSPHADVSSGHSPVGDRPSPDLHGDRDGPSPQVDNTPRRA